MQLESKLPLPWWSWARLLEKAPACKRCEQKWKSKWLWASELGKWTMKGWNTEATELTSYLETFGPLTDSTLSRSNYGCLLSAMDCASPHERKVEVSTPGAFSFFIFLFFFLIIFYKHMIFNLFIRNVTFFWTEIGIREANYRSITSVFPFLLFEKRGGHSRIQFIDQYCVFVRSSIQIPDQQWLKIRLIDAEM